jgi:hypothetical protein
MPMRIPPDAKKIRISYLDLIRAINTLKDRVVDGAGGLKARAKATMIDKGVRYAESDRVIADLRPGSTSGPIDPHDLYQLVSRSSSTVAGGGPRLTLEQFLDCVTVTKKALEKYLPGNVIDALTSKIASPEPQLFTEFREGVELDVDDLAISLADSIARAVPIKAG